MKARLADTPRLPTPASLRAISAVIDEGSFSAAARRLGISHAAVAQQIRDTESAHGIRLFDRVQGVMQPTPICLELSGVAASLAAAEREASRILGRRDAAGRPRLRLGLGNSMPGIAIAAQLARRQPEISIRIETGSHRHILAAMLRREVDVAVLPDIPSEPRFRRLAVLSQEVVAIAAAQGPLARRDSVGLAQLAAAPLIFRSRGSSTQKVVDRAFRAAGMAPEPRLVADTRDAVYEAVAVGLGVGFMWRDGTCRTDTVQRLAVPEMSGRVEEVVFALADERNQIVDLFFAAAQEFRRASVAGAQRP